MNWLKRIFNWARTVHKSPEARALEERARHEALKEYARERLTEDEFPTRPEGRRPR